MKKRFFIIIILALLGFFLSALSLYQFVSLRFGADHSSSFCSISEHVDCSKVHLSSWSSIFNIPLAAYGLSFYLFLIIIAFIGLSGKILKKGQSGDLLTISSLLATLASIALFFISEFIIKALCPVCLSMYAVNIALGCYTAIAFRDSGSIVWRIKNAFWAGLRILGIWIPYRVAGEFWVRIWSLLALCLALALMVAGEFMMTALYFQWGAGKEEFSDDHKQRIVAQYVSEWEKAPQITIEVTRNNLLEGDFIKGKEGAPVQIIEFSDFGCPHCQQLGSALSALLKEYPDAFEVIHKDFPLDSSCNTFSAGMHVGSCRSAEFARCAGEQGKFWNVADYFFNAGIPEAATEDLVKNKLLEEVVSLGLDKDAMQECLGSGRHINKIKRDAVLGDALKIQGTPSVWINGKFLRTPHPDIVRSIVEKFAHTAHVR